MGHGGIPGQRAPSPQSMPGNRNGIPPQQQPQEPTHGPHELDPTPIPFNGAPSNPKGQDSAAMYLNAGVDPNNPDSWTPESFTPERRALHDSIIQRHLAMASPVESPECHMMGGGPASGKSVAQKSGQMSIPDNIVSIDADAIKGLLPEYAEKLKSKDLTAAAHAHEESSYLSKQILKQAVDGSYHSMLDGTGDSGLKSLAKKVQMMRARGAKVIANYVTVDTNTAVARNIERAKKTGRLPPESMLRACHKIVSDVVPKAVEAGLFDEFNLFDTNGNGATKVASSKGSQMSVHDQGLWDRFLAKANEPSFNSLYAGSV